MEPVLHSFATILIHVEFIFGNLSNGFIVLSNFMDWVTKQKFSSVDKILLTLAISRITLIWKIYACFKFVYYSSLFVIGMKLQILYFSWILSSHFSFWLATALSIFYLLRIANCSWKIFLYFKWRLKQLIVGMMLGSMVFLLGSLMQRTLEERTYQYGGNTSENSMGPDFAMLTELILFNMTIFSVIPFSLALISFLLLIFPLWKHLQKMHLSTRGQGDPNTKAHRNDLRIMVSFLLLYTMYFLSLLTSWIAQKHLSTRGQGDPSTKAHRNDLRIMVSFLLLYTMYFLSLLTSWIAQKHHSELVDIICMITRLMYPSAHSFILILGNYKLKQTFLWTLRHLRCRLKGENIATTSGNQITSCYVFCIANKSVR